MINNVLLEMIKYFGHDTKRINHAVKVYSYADAICKSEEISDDLKKIVEFASILHDIGIKEAERKYNSSSGKYQEIEGPPIARNIMRNLCVAEEITGRVCYLIGNHHSYRKIDGMDFQILVEADFIVNIFEDNMSQESILSVYEKYFKTDSGKEIIRAMYLN